MTPMTESEIEQLKETVAKQAAIIEKFRTIVSHAKVEQTGVYFICGGTPVEPDGLPEMIFVCPSFGLDGFARYQKASEYSAPGY